MRVGGGEFRVFLHCHLDPKIYFSTTIYNHYVYSSHENLIGPLFQDKQGSLQEAILKVASYLTVIIPKFI